MSRRAITIAASAAVLLALAGWYLAANPRLAEAVFTIGFAALVLRMAVTLSLAAMCGAVTERSGVIDLALEAKLLFGAFAAAAVSYATGSAYAGVIGGMLAGVAVAAVQAWFTLRMGADQVIVGIALNILALGGTRLLLQLLYHEGANSPRCPGFGDATLGNPLVWIAIVAAVAMPIALTRTRWGLRLRAAGDRPESLVAVGASPTRARFAAMLVGGALAGAGGAQLSLPVDGFVADVSGGRGYIALAMVILSGWRPAIAALACVVIATADALNHRLQTTGAGIPAELAPLLPYVLTLAVLVIAGGWGRPPRSLGRL